MKIGDLFRGTDLLERNCCYFAIIQILKFSEIFNILKV